MKTLSPLSRGGGTALAPCFKRRMSKNKDAGRRGGCVRLEYVQPQAVLHIKTQCQVGSESSTQGRKGWIEQEKASSRHISTRRREAPQARGGSVERPDWGCLVAESRGDSCSIIRETLDVKLGGPIVVAFHFDFEMDPTSRIGELSAHFEIELATR